MNDATTLLFGLPGLRVITMTQEPDGTKIVDAVTVTCPNCGTVSTSAKERTVITPKDIPYGTDRILLHWNKIRWRCRTSHCERNTFTEVIPQVPARARTTGRLRDQIGTAIGDAARSVAEVAASHAVSWPTAHRAFIAHADALLAQLLPVRVLGIDETRRGKPRWVWCKDAEKWVRVDPWDTGFVDLDGQQGLLGQTEGRTSKAVVDWLLAQTPEFREGIEYVAIDPAAVYAKAVRTPGLLPNATLVVDHFHLIQLANAAVAKVRRRVTWELKDRRGGKIDPEWANRKRLLTGRERLSRRNFGRMWNALIDEDPSHQLLRVYIAKEELRKLLATVHAGGDPHLVRHRLHRFYTWCADSHIPEVMTLAASIDMWWPEINAFLGTGVTNARTEGYNRLVKTVKRSACGFRNRENSMRRIRFHCTRTQRAAARQTSC